MPQRAARITQAEIARVIRAAKQEGAAEVEVRLGEQGSILIRLSSTAVKETLEPSQEIIL